MVNFLLSFFFVLVELFSLFFLFGVCPILATGEHVPVGKEFRGQVDQSQFSIGTWTEFED